MENEVLIVQSKLKSYVKSKGLSTAGDVVEALSDQLREVLDGAIDNAKLAKRKTLMVKDL